MKTIRKISIEAAIARPTHAVRDDGLPYGGAVAALHQSIEERFNSPHALTDRDGVFDVMTKQEQSVRFVSRFSGLVALALCYLGAALIIRQMF